jgi:hypothetical protein
MDVCIKLLHPNSPFLLSCAEVWPDAIVSSHHFILDKDFAGRYALIWTLRMWFRSQKTKRTMRGTCAINAKM